MKKFINVLFVVVVLLFATNSFAGNVYFSGSGGVNFLTDATLENEIPSPDEEVSYDTGFNVGGAIGYDFGQFRTEFEIAYRQNDLDKNTVGIVSLELDGNVSATSYLFNAFYDIENNSSITPYIGGGIGIATVSINDGGFLGFPVTIDDSATVFAWKFGVGAAYEVIPKMSFTAGYELFGTADPGFENLLGEKFDAEYLSHNINLGLRYAF